MQISTLTWTLSTGQHCVFPSLGFNFTTDTCFPRLESYGLFTSLVPSTLSSMPCVRQQAECALIAAQDIKIDPMNGIPFLPDAWQVKHVEKGAPIAIAAHSGPWHLRQTIRGSTHHTTDMDEADIIYVYDHCYYMRWLAQVLHSLCAQSQALLEWCCAVLGRWSFQTESFCSSLPLLRAWQACLTLSVSLTLIGAALLFHRV